MVGERVVELMEGSPRNLGLRNSIEIMRRKSVGKQELGKRRKLPNCFDILALERALRSEKNRIFE